MVLVNVQSALVDPETQTVLFYDELSFAITFDTPYETESIAEPDETEVEEEEVLDESAATGDDEDMDVIDSDIKAFAGVSIAELEDKSERVQQEI